MEVKVKTYSELRKLQPSRWFAAWLFDVACIVGSMALLREIWDWSAVVTWPAYVLLFCIIGARQHALSLLGHEGSHKNVTEGRKLNDFFTKYLCFLPLGGCLYTYRLFHNGPSGHHVCVGTDKDPELIHRNHPTLGKEWRVPMRWSNFWFYLARDFVGGAIPHIVKLMKLTGPKRPQDIIEQVLFFLVAFSTLYFFGLWWVVLVWFMSIWLGPFWAAFRIRIWCEHVGLSGKNHTHNMKKPNVLLRFFIFPHESWLHLAHHNHASLPFYRLRAVQTLDSQQASYPQEISFLDILKGLQRG